MVRMMVMKKMLVLCFVLLASMASAQLSGNGVVGLSGPLVQVVTSGTPIIWDEQFSSDLSTSTWSITKWNAVDDGLGIVVSGGYLNIGAGKPGDVLWPSFKPTGISRIIHGDFTATTKVNFNAAENYQVAGIMAVSSDCQGTTSIAKAYDSGAGGKIIYRRDMFGGNSYDSSKPAWTADDYYLKLVRSGTSIATFYGSDGSSWTQLNPSTAWTISASDSVNLWLFAFHTNSGGALATATFDFITITRP